MDKKEGVDMAKTAVFVIGKAKPGKRDELRKLYMVGGTRLELVTSCV
jgi:hypothetical protein